MRLLAPAKINLHLRVGPRRASDGFHPLLSWMCTVGLFDKLELEQTNDDSGGLKLSTDRDDLPGDSTNLVARAADVLAEEARASGKLPARRLSGIRATLLKRIPIGAGLGGGSSDAARTLLGLDRLWQTDFSIDRILNLAAKLGSDVPFFLFGPSSICQGRGEIVDPISKPKPGWAMLVLSGIALPTAAVYRRFDEMKLGSDAAVAQPPPWQEWSKLNATDLLPRLVNDLEPAAFSLQPDLAQLRENIEQKIARPVRMSGSGGSLFSLFDDDRDCLAAVAAAEQSHRTSGIEILSVPVAPTVNDDLTL